MCFDEGALVALESIDRVCPHDEASWFVYSGGKKVAWLNDRPAAVELARVLLGGGSLAKLRDELARAYGREAVWESSDKKGGRVFFPTQRAAVRVKDATCEGCGRRHIDPMVSETPEGVCLGLGCECGEGATWKASVVWDLSW